MENSPIRPTESLPIKKDSHFLSSLTVFEFVAYTLFYICIPFANAGSYFPGSYFHIGNGFFYVLALISWFLGYTVFILFLVKFVAVFANLFRKKHVSSSLWTGFITLVNPIIANAVYVFIQISSHILDKTPGKGYSTLYDQHTFAISLLATLVVFFILFLLSKRKETLENPGTFRKIHLIYACIVTVLIATIAWGAEYKLQDIRDESVNTDATALSLSVLTTNVANAKPVNLPLSEISSIDRFTIHLSWKSSVPGLEVGSRLLGVYSDIHSRYQNKFGEQINSQSRGSCTVRKGPSGNYECDLKFYNSLLEPNDPTNYTFFVDTSVGGTESDRDEKRKQDMLSLQKILSSYKDANGSFPCTPEYTACKDGKGYDYARYNGKLLPHFDWHIFKDPLPTQEYFIFTGTKDQYENTNPPYFVAYATLESGGYFCVDNEGQGFVTETYSLSACQGEIKQ